LSEISPGTFVDRRADILKAAPKMHCKPAKNDGKPAIGLATIAMILDPKLMIRKRWRAAY